MQHVIFPGLIAAGAFGALEWLFCEAGTGPLGGIYVRSTFSLHGYVLTAPIWSLLLAPCVAGSLVALGATVAGRYRTS